MPYLEPRPDEDEAWRVDAAERAMAHFYGWASDFDGRSKYGAAITYAGSRRVADRDDICPDCEGWYWRNVSMRGSLDKRSARRTRLSRWRVTAPLEVTTSDGSAETLSAGTILTYEGRQASGRDWWAGRETVWLPHEFSLPDRRRVRILEWWDEDDDGTLVSRAPFPPVGLERVDAGCATCGHPRHDHYWFWEGVSVSVATCYGDDTTDACGCGGFVARPDLGVGHG